MAEYRDPTHLTEKERKNINLLATAIRQKMYGIDVREAIALAIELTFDTLAKENNDAYGEVIQARGVWDTLEKRLDNLSVEDINKNLGKIDQTYLAEELLEQIAGTAPINTVPADGSLTTPKYASGSVTPAKLSNSVKINNILESNTLATSKIPITESSNVTETTSNILYYEYLTVATNRVAVGNVYAIVFETNMSNESGSAQFRASTRGATDGVINSYNSEYFGSGKYVVKGISIGSDVVRVQVIAQVPKGTSLSSVLNSVSLVNLAHEVNPAVHTGDNASLTNEVFIRRSGVTNPAGHDMHKDMTLPHDDFVYVNFTVGDLVGVDEKYTMVIQTNASDNSLSSMYRVSSDGVITHTSEYIGNGKYAIIDAKFEASVEYRLTFWNTSGATVHLKDFAIGVNGYPAKGVGGIGTFSSEGDELENYALVQNKKNAKGQVTTELHDYNKCPMYPVWGHEYMWSWYEKLRLGQSVKMTWAGDSTTLNSGLDGAYTRSNLAKKIMILGGYDESLVTSINSGHGTQHTGNWLGGDKDEDKRTEHGFLYDDMQGNPDLYVLAYGFNDGSNGHFPELSWQERLDRFEENMREGLERIRGEQYDKSPDDMAIIICTPISGNGAGLQTNLTWGDRVRPIIQRLCREYKCAFVDIAARQRDRSFSTLWSTNGDKVHPLETANADYMSMFSDLLYPLLLHK